MKKADPPDLPALHYSLFTDHMPIYEYICNDCNKKFEAVRNFSQADAPIKCSYCGGEDTHRTVSKCWAIGGGGVTLSATSSGSSCSGCSGGNCAHCHS